MRCQTMLVILMSGLALASARPAWAGMEAPSAIQADAAGHFEYKCIFVVEQSFVIAGRGWSNDFNTAGESHGDCLCLPGTCDADVGDTLRWSVAGNLIDPDAEGRASNWVAACGAGGGSSFTTILPFTPPGGAEPTLRLSWDSCDPQIVSKWFTTPTTYKLVISAADFSPDPTDDDLIGVAMVLPVTCLPGCGGGFPDAWRFDDLGCQTSSQVKYSRKPLNADCPALGGMNPWSLTLMDAPDAWGQAHIRLGVVWDNPVTPGPNTRYTVWQVIFDMSYAEAGVGTPGTSCGGAGSAMSIGYDQAYFLSQTGGGARVYARTSPGDSGFVLWNHEGEVPTRSTTWGRVKAQYR